jgi:hypothetical protein
VIAYCTLMMTAMMMMLVVMITISVIKINSGLYGVLATSKSDDMRNEFKRWHLS